MFIRNILLLLFLVCFVTSRAEIKDTLVVSHDGTGQFHNIRDAIESIRAFMDYTVVVYIKNGIYKEKVVVPSWVKNVIIVGEDADHTILTNNDGAKINKMGTFRTYSLKVEGSDITIKNVTIENNAPKEMGQAVALHTEGDRLVFIGCRFLGNQDTVYTGAERTRLYFYDCYIEGTTDFIFGPSTVLFDHCTIYSKADSYITAASTPKDVEYGYVFKNCMLTAAKDVSKVYLGRPWRPYAATLFINCEMGKHICPEGWDNWRNPENEKTARFAEYENYGEGAVKNKRVKWAKQLTGKDISHFSIENMYGQDLNWFPFK